MNIDELILRAWASGIRSYPLTSATPSSERMYVNRFGRNVLITMSVTFSSSIPVGNNRVWFSFTQLAGGSTLDLKGIEVNGSSDNKLTLILSPGQELWVTYLTFGATDRGVVNYAVIALGGRDA